jgi:hypothetical protein
LKEWKRKEEIGREAKVMIGEIEGLRGESEGMRNETKLIQRETKRWRR